MKKASAELKWSLAAFLMDLKSSCLHLGQEKTLISVADWS